MRQIKTMDEMKHYVLTKLGSPVINIEVAEEQLEVEIEDAIQEFRRYNQEDGSYLQYATLNVMEGVSEYCLSGQDIEAAYDFKLTFGIDGINTLFAPTHMLLYNDWVAGGSYPGGPGAGRTMSNGGSLVLTQYQVAMQYLAEIRQKFGKQYRAKWHRGREVLEIIPTPRSNMTGMIALWKREAAENLYNHPLVKRLSVARVKKVWGSNISKYSGTLPDGLTIDGTRIIQEAISEEEKVLNDLRLESEPPDFYIG